MTNTFTFDSLLGDLRLALPSLARRPGASLLAILSLGTGIAATVASFSMLDALMFRPLPYPEPERLLDVSSIVAERDWYYVDQSVPDFLDIRRESRTMDVAGHQRASFNVSGQSTPQRVSGQRVSWNFFEVLGVQPVLGRSFLPEEELTGNSNVVVITTALRDQFFAPEKEVIGSQLIVEGQPHTVIGVLPADFWFQGRSSEIWAPLGLSGEESRSQRFLFSVARLHTDATLEQARAEVTEITRRLESEFPDSNQGWLAGARPLRERFFKPNQRMSGLIAAIAAVFVLLIACANSANLQLTQAVGRSKEFDIRGALGASRGRLFRQLMTEALITATLAGVLGAALAKAGVRTLVSILPNWFPHIEMVNIDGRALLFALVVTVITSLLFGTLPAWRSAKVDLTAALKESGRSSSGRSTGRLRQVLVVGEVALSLTLLVCCALLIQGFLTLQRTDWGWDPDNVLTFSLSLPESQYTSDEAIHLFYQDLQAELQSLPGVETVGGAEILPLQGEASTFYEIVGREPLHDHRLPVSYRAVLPGYFEAMGIPLIRGRFTSVADRPESRPTVVINQLLAETHWPGGDPIGQMVKFWRTDWEIVGIARDTLDVDLSPRPMVFVPATQAPSLAMSLVLRTQQDPSSIVAAARERVARIDPDLPLFRVLTMKEVMRTENAEYSMMPRLMTGLAILAFGLGLIGLYSVISYSVSQRTQEIGIRLALGANQNNVLGMIMRQGSVLIGYGIVLGLLISAGVARSLAVFLLGVSPFHVATYSLAVFALGTAGAAATLIPARRATIIDPMQALRNE